MLRLAVSLETDESFFSFRENVVVIGSGPDVHLLLEHESIGARHAKLEVEGSEIVIERFPGHEVWVNGESVARSPVREGDRILVGDYRVWLRTEDPPEKTEQYFLDAIARDPRDDEPRAVYADWLEEKGRHDHAALLRAELDVRRQPTDEEFLVLAKTIRELASKVSLTWRRAVARPRIENCNTVFRLECPKRWDGLDKMPDPDQRWCNACDQVVTFARDIETARRLAVQRHCVALDPIVAREPGDLEWKVDEEPLLGDYDPDYDRE